MKNLKRVLAFSTLVLFASFSFAQQIESGDVAPLKGVTSINIVYDYSNMAVGSFDNENDYLNKKRDDYSKDPAKFEKFKNGWFGARKARYEPMFEELFNKTVKKVGLYGVNNGKDAAVTLKVETQFTEPGFNAGVVRMNAKINVKCTFSKDGKPFLVYVIRNIPGGQAMGYDFDAGSRIAESYAKAGKMLGKDVSKRLKKLK